MKDCESVSESISMLIDGELPPADAEAVREHIACCGECRKLYEAFSSVSAALAQDMEEPPDKLTKSVMAGVKKARVRALCGKAAKYASIAACLALVIFASAKLAGMEGSDAAGEDVVAAQSAGKETFDETLLDSGMAISADRGLSAGAVSVEAEASDGRSCFVSDDEQLGYLSGLLCGTPVDGGRLDGAAQPDYSLSITLQSGVVVEARLYVMPDGIYAKSGNELYIVEGARSDFDGFIDENNLSKEP